MENNMEKRSVVIETLFNFDEGNDENIIIVIVPISVSNNDIVKKLNHFNRELMTNDEENEMSYGKDGCNIETLIEYINDKMSDWNLKLLETEIIWSDTEGEL